MSWNGESQRRVVKMKQGVPWPINLCKLEARNSPTEIEKKSPHMGGCHRQKYKNTKIELVCNNR